MLLAMIESIESKREKSHCMKYEPNLTDRPSHYVTWNKNLCGLNNSVHNFARGRFIALAKNRVGCTALACLLDWNKNPNQKYRIIRSFSFILFTARQWWRRLVPQLRISSGWATTEFQLFVENHCDCCHIFFVTRRGNINKRINHN